MCGHKIKNIIDKIKLLSNKQNSNIIINYHNYLVNKGITLKSQLNNLQPVYYFALHLGENINFIDVKEKMQITTFLNTRINIDDPEKKYISTWNQYLIKLNTFYRWLYNSNSDKDDRDWTTPDFMKIKKKQTKRVSPYNGTEIWEKDELISIIKYERSRRNKAIISLLWDLDARPHEITLLKIKHIRLREKYGEGEIPFTAKTGSGPILLTFSFPYVRDWLNEHPDRNNNESYLICNLKNGKPIQTDFVYYIMFSLKERIKRLVITDGSISDQREKERLEYFLNTKKWNPYCIRHSAITADSDYLPEYALKKKVRWSMNSQQGRRYIKNRMGDELRNKILEQNGIIVDSDMKPKITNTVCPRCELVNQLENKFCSKCSYPLTPQAFEEIKKSEESRFIELEKKYSEKLANLTENLESKFHQIISKINLEKLGAN